MSRPMSRPAGTNSDLCEGHFSGKAGHSNHPHLFAIKVKLIHSKHAWGKLKNVFNPNHRHDEPHEKEIDAWREEIANSHRYKSFAPETVGNDVKWYVDGRDYFWAVSVALENAKEVVYIADWWLSPELFLRRPPSEAKEWRLDRVLKRKAEEGVKIFVIVYKEIAQALTCDSAHTKTTLEELCPRGNPGHGNIYVMRHPDHDPFLHGADMTFFWAHHEKFMVIDHKLAFIGGLDMCFGRWDMHQHPLADVHPEGVANEIWPGQDFNNNRILDFQNVNDWKQNHLDKTKYGRMPWHDVSIGIVGPAVMSIADHFVERWNFIKRDKHKRSPKRPWLQLRGIPDDLAGVQRPTFPVGGYYEHPLHSPDEFNLENRGPCEVQIVRSSADWSHGLAHPETSIQTAYIDTIENAQHFIYIENQFFITATGGKQHPIHNQIGRAIVNAVTRAHNENRKLRVIIIIPAIPGFPGDLREDSATGTRAIIDYQYKSINRGENSIYGQLQKEGIDPTKYIFVFNLRIYDRIHTTDALLNRQKETGVGYRELQAANAKDVLGAKGAAQDDSSSSSESSILDSAEESRMAGRRKLFEEDMDSASHAHNSVAKAAMKGSKPLTDETWDDGVDQEKMDFFQEELYVHAKLLIVDDEKMIVGSSNINDRSQNGDHDSELSAVVKHGPTVSSLRKQLWMEHLGLLPAQELEGDDDPNAQPPGHGGNRCEVDPLVEDAMSDELWNAWTSQATTNTEIYRYLFHPDPDDCIKTWKDYDTFCPKRDKVPTGHIWNGGDFTTEQVKEELAKVKGHLVWMPLDFLKDETMAEPGLQVNAITESIYC
ncbi:phospholipase D/nuclease [Wilcoxina mikolae CBS 423.85]|nr:phospholipase D/nuclease [Wilcoxina mikolae CBS 423.85]